MLTRHGFERYLHTIRAAYHSIGVPADTLLLPDPDICMLSQEDALAACFEQIRQRLGAADPASLSSLLPAPRSVSMYFHNRKVLIPLINTEGVEWYSNIHMLICDFIAESFMGMHAGARVIYDIGGHQGVWALYYSGAVGEHGRVYTFEPSMLNVECAALSFFLNGANNVILNAVGLGRRAATIRPNDEGVLVGGVSHPLNILPLSQLLWEKPDFIKIDIEGYEYDLLQDAPHIYDLCGNIHLEIHIPWLVNRGIDYREIYDRIPFDRFRVRWLQGATATDVGPADDLSGFCTLLLTPR